MNKRYFIIFIIALLSVILTACSIATVYTFKPADVIIQAKETNQNEKIKTEDTKSTQIVKTVQQKSTQNAQTTKPSSQTKTTRTISSTQMAEQVQKVVQTQKANQQAIQQESIQRTQQGQPIQEKSIEENITQESTENSTKDTQNSQVPQNTTETTTSNEINEDIDAQVKRVSALVQSSIVYGTMTRDDGSFKKGETVQIIRDKGNGKTYHVSTNDGREGWINGKSISIPADPATVQSRMSTEDIEFYVNHIKQFSSDSQYFIWVDLSRQLVYIFQGSQGNWKLIKTSACASGKNETPTIRGTFKIYERGKQFSSGSAIAKNWVRFYDTYMFHSILVNSKGNVIDGTLGKRASHGCIRLSMEDIKWVYDNIPNGTTVWIN